MAAVGHGWRRAEPPLLAPLRGPGVPQQLGRSLFFVGFGCFATAQPQATAQLTVISQLRVPRSTVLRGIPNVGAACTRLAHGGSHTACTLPNASPGGRRGVCGGPDGRRAHRRGPPRAARAGTVTGTRPWGGARGARESCPRWCMGLPLSCLDRVARISCKGNTGHTTRHARMRTIHSHFAGLPSPFPNI